MQIAFPERRHMRSTFFLSALVILVAQRNSFTAEKLSVRVVSSRPDMTAQSAAPPESDDGRQWLNPQTVADSPLAAASRASALNQNDAAEKLLRQIINRAPKSSEAGEAHKLLSRIYIRTGRYKRASDNLGQWRRDFPNSADAQAELKDVEQFHGLPDQINGQRRPAVLKHEEDLSIPVTVNGQECTFLMDSGAWVSIISQQAAERLGLEFRGVGRVVGDSSGKGFAAKTV